MFRVEFFVEDKRLADALRSLAGKTRGQPAVQPVVNVEPAAGKLKANGSGTLVDMLGEFVHKNGVAELQPKKVKEWLEKHGFSADSASYVLRGAVNQGWLKKTGQGNATVYHVK